jgi:hypothetical protein
VLALCGQGSGFNSHHCQKKKKRTRNKEMRELEEWEVQPHACIRTHEIPEVECAGEGQAWLWYGLRLLKQRLVKFFWN